MGCAGAHRNLKVAAGVTTIAAVCFLLGSRGRAEEAVVDGLLAQARASYEKRQSKAESVKAVELYEKAIAAKATYEACWEGARAASHLGQNAWAKTPSQKRQVLYKKGVDWATRATTINPGGAEGHYYVAVLTGLHAQEQTFLHQMTAARSIRLAAERAAKIDPRIECGGPVRLLGLYYRHLPAAFGGDDDTAVAYLEKAVRYCPDDAEIRYEIAECLHRVGQNDRARKEAQWVLDHPPRDPHDREEYDGVKRETEELLESMR